MAAAANLRAELKPDNPAYVMIDTQLKSVREDIRVSRAKLDDMRTKVERYEQYLSRAPQVEKEYQALLRDYESTQFKYSEIKSKQMSAELAQNLESERKGERFTLIQPPELPILPVSPNRIALVLFGMLLAIGAGVGAALALEAVDGGIYGEKTLASVVGAAPMVVIPYMETRAEATKHNRKRVLMVLGLLGVIALAILAFHIFIKPLDVMWYILLRKLGI
ncbi:hypothetical protein GYB62_01915 [bacterium]|nr:hypothetical protein [bacterium]